MSLEELTLGEGYVNRAMVKKARLRETSARQRQLDVRFKKPFLDISVEIFLVFRIKTCRSVEKPVLATLPKNFFDSM